MSVAASRGHERSRDMFEKSRSNLGVVGLCMVTAATVLSPTGFCGLPLFLLVPLGFGGLAVCFVSLAWTPRWPGVLGIVLGVTCVALWSAFFISVSSQVTAQAAKFGLTVYQHSEMSMTAMDLAEQAESQRQPDGSPVLSIVLARNPVDPWGRAYRYVLNSTERGYTFVSDGADGLPSTADDIDLFAIQYGGMFSLPPIRGK